MFRRVPLSIIRSFFYCTHSNPVWHMPLLCVQWKTPDDGQMSCPKHVEFYSKNKFEKLVHLGYLIIGIYHDERSPERQKQCRIVCVQTATHGTTLIFCNCGSAMTLISNDNVHLPVVINVSVSQGMPPYVLPPGHGRSVTRLLRLGRPWGAVTLCCPDGVSGDIGGCSARRALKPKFYQPTQTMVTAGILPFRENSHGRAGNRNRDLMISSQRLWPLDHEAGQECMNIRKQSCVQVFGP